MDALISENDPAFQVGLQPKNGMTTGQVDWAAIYGAKNVRWQFGEHPNTDSTIAKDLIAQHLVTQEQVSNLGWNNSSPAWRDEIWTDAAIDILTRHTPNLLLFICSRRIPFSMNMVHLRPRLTPLMRTRIAASRG